MPDFQQHTAADLRKCRATAPTAVHVVFEEMPGGTEPETRQLKLTLPAGETVYESAAYFSARSLRMTARGPLELRGVGLLSRSQPEQDRGAFECSDPFLNDLWRVSWDTLRLCLQDIHLDSPHHQEALGDHGDYLVEMLMGYPAFGDYALAHQDLRRMALDLAGGVVPTPQREVRIEWERRKDTVQVQVQAPNGIEIITEGGRQGPDVSQQTGVLT
jgi:hypothetical protein